MKSMIVGVLLVTSLLVAACEEDESDELCPQICEELVYEGDVAIGGSGDLSNLAGYTEITGRLEIEHTEDLADLGDLSCLRSVGEYLRIRDNPGLSSLDGLGCLTHSGRLTVSDNAALTSLDGLGNLTSVGSDVWIVDNQALPNVDGLEGLTEIHGDLAIQGNGSLTDLTGLGNVTSVGYNLWLESSPNTDFADLGSLESIGASLIISSNDSLTSLGAFHGVTHLGGSLEITENYALPTCEAWELHDHFVALGFDPYSIICSNLEDECEWEECVYGG